MNGTGPQPLPGELFQHGISRGAFDGDDLMIETDHFTFDPDGIDDHLGMASSVRKKITERYRLIDDNSMRLIITLDDPTFLTKPFTWAFMFTKTGLNGPRQGWRVRCRIREARTGIRVSGQQVPPTRGSAPIRRETLMTRFLVPFCGVVARGRLAGHGRERAVRRGQGACRRRSGRCCPAGCESEQALSHVQGAVRSGLHRTEAAGHDADERPLSRCAAQGVVHVPGRDLRQSPLRRDQDGRSMGRQLLGRHHPH